jgi:hypothetical protein
MEVSFEALARLVESRAVAETALDHRMKLTVVVLVEVHQGHI